MLFDLRGRGRRRTVRVIYFLLALLMGGGLIGFGIGSATSGGGLFDAVLGNGSSGTSATKSIDKQILAEVAKTRASPRDAAVWAQLARLRYQRAGIDGIIDDAATGTSSYTGKGKAKLSLASSAWEHYLALDPKTPDAQLARLMVQAYGTGALEQPAKAVTAMQIVTAAEKPPNSNLYAQLAQLAYTAHDSRTGDLAADRAVELADKANKKLLRTQLDQIKTQAATPAATTSATPTG